MITMDSLAMQGPSDMLINAAVVHERSVINTSLQSRNCRERSTAEATAAKDIFAKNASRSSKKKQNLIN